MKRRVDDHKLKEQEAGWYIAGLEDGINEGRKEAMRLVRRRLLRASRRARNRICAGVLNAAARGATLPSREWQP